jgi:protease I
MPMSQVKAATIGMLVYNFPEQAEIEIPLKRFRDSGFKVQLISADTSLAIQSLDHIAVGEQFTADRLLASVDPTAYDALVLTGGIVNGDALRNDPKVTDWIAHFIDQEKPLGVIGYGVWSLISADEIDGLRVTSAPSMKTDVMNAGGEWVNVPVIVDHMVITCRGNKDIEEFTNRFIGRLRQYTFMNTIPGQKELDVGEQHSDSTPAPSPLAVNGGRSLLHTLDRYKLVATEYTGRKRVIQPSQFAADEDEASDTY